MYNKLLDGTTQSTTLDPTQYLKVNFKYSENGKDPLSGEDLRKALVKYIQTRDNFISEDDFYNVIEKYTTDFRLLFKKMLVQENVFYLQRALRDDYQTPVRSLNLMPEIFIKGAEIKGLHYYTQDTGNLIPGLYFYVIRAYDKFNNSVSTDEIKASLVLSVESGSIHLKWSPVPGACRYRLYGRTAQYERFWELTEPEYLDNGSDEGSISSPDGLQELEEYPYVLFPEYEHSGTTFVSPFLYKFNPVYNYYEGWLFYPELLINFASIEQTASGEISGASLPSIYLNLIYDQILEKTTISLKSYQRISEWAFNMTIPELGLKDIALEPVDESTFSYEYKENHGFITDPFVITISGFTQGVNVFIAKTAQINQRYDLTDLLQIPIFPYNGVRYLVDLPIIDKSKFDPNKVFYLDKILAFLLGFNFEENRMVSDNLEFRFLNTDSITSYLLQNCLVQGKNLYKGVTYLDKHSPISIADSPGKIPMNEETWVIAGTEVPIDSTEIDGEALKIYQESGFGGLKDAQDYSTYSPYSIVINGDYTKKISSGDIIRVKYAVTENINGMYTVLKVESDGNKTTIYTIEKINYSSGEGKLVFATYEQWRKGGPDNIAIWQRDSESWKFVTVNPNDLVTVKEPIYSTLLYTQENGYVDYQLKLPLNLKMKIFVDKDAVNQYGVDLEEQRNTIILEVAKYLQMYMTGTDIVYYPAAIIEFVMENRRYWIKGMVIYTTESSDPPFEFKNGIEAYPEYKIRDNISSSKMEILKYTSAFYWWNVDNITIEYELNG